MDTQGFPYISVDQRSYYVHTELPAPRLSRRLLSKLESFKQAWVPLTVIDWTHPTFDQDDVQKLSLKLKAEDDVWSPCFFALIVLLRPHGGKTTIHRELVWQVDKSKSKLGQGLYVASATTGHVYHASLLVPDTNGAFCQGAVVTGPSPYSFTELPITNGLTIPSRLSSLDDTRALAGQRFAVKDNIHVKGLKTGFGNKAFLDTYQTASATAPCVKGLLDAGAVFIGKLKTSELAEGVDPNEWIDYVCPFNPRGDGQQKPSSSSTGSAVAAASYGWLDFTVGTDTGGSIRHPAGVNGVFGQRPTQGIINLANVLGATDLFNTVGVFAREVDVFCRAGSYLVNPVKELSLARRPRKYNLLYPTRSMDHTGKGQHRWFPHPASGLSTWTLAEKTMDSMICAIEAQLGCQRMEFDLLELWKATPPVGHSRSIDEAVGSIYSTLTTSLAMQGAVGRFIEDHKAASAGKDPDIAPLIRRRLDHGKSVSAQSIEDAIEAMKAFNAWTETQLFGSFDQDAMTLVVFPQSYGCPDYRDQIPDRSVLFNDNFSIFSFGYLVGCPDYTIPIGEVPYSSEVTGETEYLPVSISLIGRPGTDLELFDTIRYLKTAGVIRDVMPGSRLYVEPACDC